MNNFKCLAHFNNERVGININIVYLEMTEQEKKEYEKLKANGLQAAVEEEEKKVIKKEEEKKAKVEKKEEKKK